MVVTQGDIVEVAFQEAVIQLVLAHAPHLLVFQRLDHAVHHQDIPSRALDFPEFRQVVLRLQAEGNAMKTVVAHLEALIPVALGDMHIPQTLEEPEGAGLVEALGSVVVAADYDHRNCCFHQPLQPSLEDEQGLDLGPDVMEDISCMNHCIGMSPDYLLDRLFKSGVDHLLYPVLAVLIQAAVAGESQMRIGEVDYLHGSCSLSFQEWLKAAPLYEAFVFLLLVQTAQVILKTVDPGRHGEGDLQCGDHRLALLQGLDLYVHGG